MNKKEALKIVKDMIKDDKIKTNSEYLNALNFMLSQVDTDNSDKIKTDVKNVISECKNKTIIKLKEVDRSFGLRKDK